MKKNIISIDLDKISDKVFIDDVKNAQVPTPCTLTDVIEKWDLIKVGCHMMYNSDDVEDFKKNHLYKETLEDWRVNAEEDYINTPISVLRYISELEKIKK